MKHMDGELASVWTPGTRVQIENPGAANDRDLGTVLNSKGDAKAGSTFVKVRLDTDIQPYYFLPMELQTLDGTLLGNLEVRPR